MKKKFNENLLKALAKSREAVEICKQALVDSNDASCRAMYAAIQKDCERHIDMLTEEIDLHKVQEKWDG